MDTLIENKWKSGYELVELNEIVDQLVQQQQEISKQWMLLWKEFSAFDSWQFWFHLFLFVAPLILLYFTLDRKRAFEIGFFGFNVHVWFGYFDAFGTRQGLWSYPYQIFPLIPNSLGMDASLVPILFMLVYQWTTREKKNYYVYALLLSLALTFILKPIFVSMNLFKLYMGTTYGYLFLTYIIIMVLSKWIANVFFHFEHEANNPFH